ncbi:MAG: helix-turn-helix transcriptional regulator [Bythopirellula sp.]|nr:helix-turn-helix transcriptional regulator [Bythopirellula sp.]
MAKKTYQSVTRNRKLTNAETTRLKELRKRVEKEILPAKPDPMRVTIAKLRALREAKGISLGQLSELTGMTRGNIARLESQKNATLKTLERYASGLGCNLEISVVTAK